MAWNEPGDSGDKDPWGSKSSNQGPPDLDEVVKKLQDRLNRLFGGKRGGGSGGGATKGPGAGLGAGSIGLIFIIALIVWALSGIYIIDEGKRGVVLQFGAYNTITMPGPHWYPRFIQSVYKVDVDNIRSIELGYRADEALMLTQDENIIDIKFAVQYRVQDARNYLFNVRDPDETLRQAMESAVREVIGRSEMDFIITGGRSAVVDTAQKLLQSILDNYKTGLILTQLTMQDAQPPQQVQGAFADAVKAREDKERVENEAEAYANDIIPRARGAAARIMQEAEGYKARIIADAEGETDRFLKVLAEYRKAPDVTRKRLYLDTLESTLSKSSKVLIDTKSGNNLLYLPLDRIMQQGKMITESSATTTPVGQPGVDVQLDTQQRLRDNLRRREVR
jgi:membrane protease subunit HflK